MNELKTLENSSNVNDKKNARSLRLANEHYFCPSDELPK
jgi:hypothetical protein